jgi:hypothetical protein
MEGVIAQSISQAAAVAASAALAVAAVCDSLVSLVGDEGVQGGAADPGQEEEEEGRACWLGTGVEADGSRVAAPPLRFTLPSNSTVKSIVEVRDVRHLPVFARLVQLRVPEAAVTKYCSAGPLTCFVPVLLLHGAGIGAPPAVAQYTRWACPVEPSPRRVQGTQGSVSLRSLTPGAPSCTNVVCGV